MGSPYAVPASVSVLAFMTSLVFLPCQVCPEFQGYPGCSFPDFLQSKPPGYGNWTFQYEGNTHVVHVTNGTYSICSSRGRYGYYGYSHFEEEDNEEFCRRQQNIRVCVRAVGNDMFVVKHPHLQPEKNLQCIRFFQRSRAVVQLGISDLGSDTDTVCKKSIRLDYAVWISIPFYSEEVTDCAITGGYNFDTVIHFSDDHRGQVLCPRVQPAVRLEADCMQNEGLSLHFKDRNCIPEDSYLRQIQHLQCIAEWQVDDHIFTLLRKPDVRAFYCMRIKYKDTRGTSYGSVINVEEVVIFFDWLCYRTTDLRVSENEAASYGTGYVQLSDATMSSGPSPGIRHLIDLEPDTEIQECNISERVIGTWTIREPGEQKTKLHIYHNHVRHSKLGKLKCVSTNPSKLSQQVILWGEYKSGCYPRFICMFYDSPDTDVLRYRFGHVQQWSFQMNWSSICAESSFRLKADPSDPGIEEHEKPWEVALKPSLQIQHNPCIFPITIPDNAAFIDNFGNMGCIIFRSRMAISSFSMMYLKPHERIPGRFHEIRPPLHYECVTAMTYLDTYKTTLTLTKHHRQEVLCWMVVNGYTLVVVKTSACNKYTAHGILRRPRDRKYTEHLQWQLSLNVTDDDLVDKCQTVVERTEREWEKNIEAQIQQVAEDGAGSGAYSRKTLFLFYLPTAIILLIVQHLRVSVLSL